MSLMEPRCLKPLGAKARLSSAQCPYCGNPLVTPNVKADATQCFQGPHNSPSMPPKLKASRAFRKANAGPENGCPGWEVPHRDELRTSSCSNSEQQRPLLRPSWGWAHPRVAVLGPHSQGQSSPTPHLCPLQSGWGLPGPLGQRRSNGIYVGWGWHIPRERTESSGADSSVLPLTCFILPSDHPICMPPLFRGEPPLLLSLPLDSIWHLPPLAVGHG